MNRNPVIIGTGSYAPDNVVTNSDLEEKVDTSDEWIRSRSGIEERRFADDDQSASDLAEEAGRAALEDAEMSPDAIDLVIVPTATPDNSFPSTACAVQDKLGISGAAAFDISAACTGFIYGLSIAHSQLQAGVAENVLVVASEVYSRYLDWDDRTTCVLFGDGAGAAVISNSSDNTEAGFESLYIKADGEYKDVLTLPGGGSSQPLTPEAVENGEHLLAMDGRAVFRVAVRKMKSSALRVLKRADLESDDIDWVVCHQANTRIIDSVRKRLKMPEEKMIVNLQKYGNTSAASIGLALDEARRDGRITSGDRVLFVAFGGGLTWGACIVTFP